MDRHPLRILIAKPGLDGHDVGARVVALALRDAGCEVIYSGLRRTPREIAAMALDEDVDAIGLSILSGAHVPLCREVSHELRKAGLAHVPWLVGGHIPESDRQALLDLGAAEVLPAGTPLPRLVEAFRSAAPA